MPDSSKSFSLYTFPVSHFSEKARWTLDAAGVSYKEETLVPFLHVPTVLWLSRKTTTVPVLKTPDEGNVQDSTRILKYLEKHDLLGSLLPADPAARAAAWQAEDRFDAVGPHVIRFAYSDTLSDTAGIYRLWSVGGNRLQKLALKPLMPALTRVAAKAFGTQDKAKVEKSTGAIDKALSAIEARLAAGEQYLAGKTFSFADIAAASLLAPVAAPAEHPLYSLPEMVAAARAKWTPEQWERPGLQWVRRMYRLHRGAKAA